MRCRVQPAPSTRFVRAWRGRRGSGPPLHDGLTPSLQFAAKGSGAIGVAIRRWRRQAKRRRLRSADRGNDAWPVTALPFIPSPVPGVGRARWRVELIRCRAGESATFKLEACDAQGRLGLPLELVHRPTLAARASIRGVSDRACLLAPGDKHRASNQELAVNRLWFQEK
jgi:hypothetical protein